MLGLSSLLAQAVLRAPLAAATTQEFRIAGSWEDPQVERLQRLQLAAADDTPTAPENAPAAASALQCLTARKLMRLAADQTQNRQAQRFDYLSL